MLLLDTNHCSYAILGNARVIDRLENLGDESIATCTIVKGELMTWQHDLNSDRRILP